MRWFCAVVANVLLSQATPVLRDDFHYPAEEPGERSTISVPNLISTKDGSCVLKSGSTTQTVKEGDLAFGTWRLMGTMPSMKPPAVALEQNFEQWGMHVLLAVNQEPILLRKSVGKLSGIRQPYFNFTGDNKQYFSDIHNSLEDLPAAMAANMTADGELDYSSLASTLAPQRDIAEISNNADVTKFVVTHNGRVKCASYGGLNGKQMNGITEYDDLHAPPPNQQTIIFDPANHTTYWPNRFENTKTGLVGGHLRIANVGSYSSSVQKGFEVVAFSPVSNVAQKLIQDVECKFDGPFKNAYIAACSQGCSKHSTLVEAEAACGSAPDCNGITLHKGKYELRSSPFVNASAAGETSWLLHDASCRHLPRRPNVNYSPGVYVRFREEAGDSYGEVQHFYVTNTSLSKVQSSEFYAKLFEYQEFYSAALSNGMEVTLPDSDRRQVDMAKSTLMASWGNFVGDQSNYGNGGTYWSIGREDNGSLPLNILSVEEANLEWGLCNLALPHIGYYFDNYLREDGTINYYSWGGFHDSIGDQGRLASLFVKATQLCHDASWETRYLPSAERLARYMLTKRQNATKSYPSEKPEVKGLVVGVPEHDWHATKDKYFYSNQVVLIRGMEELGAYMMSETAPKSSNTTLGKMLLDDAVNFRSDLSSSLALCSVKDGDGNTIFLPPWAERNFTPFTSMTAHGRTPEYSNFRFFSEPLLADVLPRDIEGAFLTFHNHKGGRIGGASRFSGWLDDMPTAGWGYGAVTNNRTDDFLALLYGHMATYLSRGTFHSTEQLSFGGEGWYRSFLHWHNPPINGTEQRLQYYGSENDVSFCVVSNIIVARMTRWQLVLEDFYRPQFGAEKDVGAIWLARGAPKRWFGVNGGFKVKNAPTRHGKVSYEVTMDKNEATYQVTVPKAAPASLKWKLRWPGGAQGVQCHGCSVVDISPDGTVAVTATSTSFTVQASISHVAIVV